MEENTIEENTIEEENPIYSKKMEGIRIVSGEFKGTSYTDYHIRDHKIRLVVGDNYTYVEYYIGDSFRGARERHSMSRYEPLTVLETKWLHQGSKFANPPGVRFTPISLMGHNCN